VTEFEGAYREITDDDAAGALVRFAVAERGTQIVLGAGRPRSAFRPMGGVVEKVLRFAPTIDVHIVSAGGDKSSGAASSGRGRGQNLR